MALERSVGSPLPPTHAHHALLPSHPPFTPPTTLHLADDCRSTDSATAATLVAEISDGARATTSTSFWDHFSRISPLCATLPHTRRAMCSTVLSTLAHRGHAHIVSGPSCVERTVAAPLGVRDRIADRIDASRHAPEHRQGGRLCVNARCPTHTFGGSRATGERRAGSPTGDHPDSGAGDRGQLETGHPNLAPTQRTSRSADTAH